MRKETLYNPPMIAAGLCELRHELDDREGHVHSRTVKAKNVPHSRRHARQLLMQKKDAES